MTRIKSLKTSFNILFSKRDLRSAFGDSSAILLIVSNLMVFVFVATGKWTFAEVLWTYLAQSLVIGFFVFWKLFLFRYNIAKSQYFEKKSVDKIYFAFFFLFHFGFFHFAYYLFLRNSFGTRVNWHWLALGSAVFFLNHLYSFLANFKNDSK